MFDYKIYFDDSGTHRGSPIAIAACYASPKRQWDEFVRNWDRIRLDEGFDVFHMADFVAKPEYGVKPFCDWSKEKKDRVYAKVASVIRTRADHGFACAVPKDAFDEFATQKVRDEYAKHHYTFAVKTCMGTIQEWREKYAITEPMQYIFDRMSQGKGEIMAIWEAFEDDPDCMTKYGFTKDGFSIQDKKLFKPLQAADVLAWQMHNYMQAALVAGEKAPVHAGFVRLREDRPMDLGFYSREQLKKTFDDWAEYELRTGRPAYRVK